MTSLYTIGHSNTTAGDFVGLLHANGVVDLVDIRSLPGSRRSPWFDQESMRSWLSEAGINYTHILLLGGRRRNPHIEDQEVNAGWRNKSFKNYADYTLTPDFERGIDILSTLARDHGVAIMCGEPVPWRCHRMLVSNVMVARGWKVTHIIGQNTYPHVLGAWGVDPVVDGHGVVTYPKRQLELPI